MWSWLSLLKQIDKQIMHFPCSMGIRPPKLIVSTAVTLVRRKVNPKMTQKSSGTHFWCSKSDFETGKRLHHHHLPKKINTNNMGIRPTAVGYPMRCLGDLPTPQSYLGILAIRWFQLVSVGIFGTTTS